MEKKLSIISHKKAKILVEKNSRDDLFVAVLLSLF